MLYLYFNVRGDIHALLNTHSMHSTAVRINNRATDTQSEHLSIAHIEAQLTAYQQDPETDNLAQHFDTVYKNRTSHMQHSYPIHPESNHEIIVHAALIALKHNAYPVIKTPIGPGIFPQQPLELNKRLFIHATDDICLSRHQITQLKAVLQLIENDPVKLHHQFMHMKKPFSQITTES